MAVGESFDNFRLAKMQALVHEYVEQKLAELVSKTPEISEASKVPTATSATNSTSSSGSKTGSSSLHTSGTSFDYCDGDTGEPVPEAIPNRKVQREKPAKKIFKPVESLGIEVDPFNSAGHDHLFHANLEINAEDVPPLINVETGMIEKFEPADSEDKAFDRKYLNRIEFDRAPIGCSKIRTRKDRELPLFLNSKKQPKCKESGYIFRRFGDTMKLEHSGIRGTDEAEPEKKTESTEVRPVVEREIIFEGSPLHEKKLNVEFLGVDAEDFLKIQIADAKLEVTE